MWPWPYVCPDRIAVREPFCIMVNNGWRRQNLIGAHHFIPETNQLNAAGQLRVQWIMTQAPPDRRSIFVERSLDQNVNNQRIAAVQEYSTQVALDGRAPQVSQTHLVSEGRPASVVDCDQHEVPTKHAGARVARRTTDKQRTRPITVGQASA